MTWMKQKLKCPTITKLWLVFMSITDSPGAAHRSKARPFMRTVCSCVSLQALDLLKSACLQWICCIARPTVPSNVATKCSLQWLNLKDTTWMTHVNELGNITCTRFLLSGGCLSLVNISLELISFALCGLDCSILGHSTGSAEPLVLQRVQPYNWHKCKINPAGRGKWKLANSSDNQTMQKENYSKITRSIQNN